MELINILGEILAQKTNLSPPAGRGLIKLAIKDQFGPFTALEEIDFDNLKQAITVSLRNRLEKLEINNWRNLIITLLEELIKNQSITTISKI